jgi:hypothetical protein
MWTDHVRQPLALVPAALLLAGLLTAACGGGGTPADSAAGTTAPAGDAAMAAPVTTPEPATVAEIFPPGEGRDQLLNSCGSCHNLACSAIGQRTDDRWESLKEAHSDKIGPAELDQIFTYLKANFNDTRPAPNVPARFLEGGCTPF